MESTKKIIKLGGSLILIIPPLYAKHIEITEGETITIKDDKGKHGKFISFWKEE